jgi:glycosyltransferase involved in cell wall biosynthesis
MKISVFINTLNEAKRIRACLESVAWADEIIVVDMHSDDDTVKIVREFTDKVFLFDRVGYCEPARKFAAAQTTGDWLLNIDADELITLKLKNELLRIAKEDRYDAVYVPFKNYFWGEEMRHSGCGRIQDRHMRFYKKGKVVFNDQIHAGIQLDSSAKVLKIDDPEIYFLHFSYLSPQHYWAKSEKYTTVEAENLFNSGKEYTFKAALKDIWNAFWKRYIKKGKGYKDGPWGFIYCVWTAVYKLNTYAKYLLMKTYGTTDYVPEIQKKYDVIIQDTLKEFKGDS